MTLWMVRAGSRGEQEQEALDNDIVTIRWNEIPSLTDFETREELKAYFEEIAPNKKKRAIANEAGQLWSFYMKIQRDDLVALPLKTQSAIAIGKITEDYEYVTDMGEDIHHIRKVEWIRKDIPRTDFPQDILYSLGAYMTVCRIQRNNAEARVRSIVYAGQDLPGEIDEDEILAEETIDIVEVATDQIRRYIDENIKGHDLTRLVEAIIQAKGYATQRAEPGPDGGVDILAGSGAFGFTSPKLCVQVKSGSSPVDVIVLRNLQGSIQTFNAEQGLLVSWSGFNRKVIREARRSFFTIRLWDSGNLIQEIQKHYTDFPESLKAELPLQRIWALVPEDQ